MRYPDRSSRITPGMRPVRENAYGSERAPAPSVALHKLEMAPGDGHLGVDWWRG